MPGDSGRRDRLSAMRCVALPQRLTATTACRITKSARFARRDCAGGREPARRRGAQDLPRAQIHAARVGMAVASPRVSYLASRRASWHIKFPGRRKGRTYPRCRRPILHEKAKSSFRPGTMTTSASHRASRDRRICAGGHPGQSSNSVEARPTTRPAPEACGAPPGAPVATQIFAAESKSAWLRFPRAASFRNATFSQPLSRPAAARCAGLRPRRQFFLNHLNKLFNSAAVAGIYSLSGQDIVIAEPFSGRARIWRDGRPEVEPP